MNYPKPTIPIPSGARVRQMSDPKPIYRDSVLRRASLDSDKAAAVQLVATALNLDPESRCADVNLPDAFRWSKFDACARLKALGDWIRAECFDLMDLIEVDTIVTMGD